MKPYPALFTVYPPTISKTLPTAHHSHSVLRIMESVTPLVLWCLGGRVEWTADVCVKRVIWFRTSEVRRLTPKTVNWSSHYSRIGTPTHADVTMSARSSMCSDSAVTEHCRSSQNQNANRVAGFLHCVITELYMMQQCIWQQKSRGR